MRCICELSTLQELTNARTPRPSAPAQQASDSSDSFACHTDESSAREGSAPSASRALRMGWTPWMSAPRCISIGMDSPWDAHVRSDGGSVAKMGRAPAKCNAKAEACVVGDRLTPYRMVSSPAKTALAGQDNPSSMASMGTGGSTFVGVASNRRGGSPLEESSTMRAARNVPGGTRLFGVFLMPSPSQRTCGKSAHGVGGVEGARISLGRPMMESREGVKKEGPVQLRVSVKCKIMLLELKQSYRYNLERLKISAPTYKYWVPGMEASNSEFGSLPSP
jgi:hypothetical protein